MPSAYEIKQGTIEQADADVEWVRSVFINSVENGVDKKGATGITAVHANEQEEESVIELLAM